MLHIFDSSAFVPSPHLSYMYVSQRLHRCEAFKGVKKAVKGSVGWTVLQRGRQLWRGWRCTAAVTARVRGLLRGESGVKGGVNR